MTSATLAAPPEPLARTGRRGSAAGLTWHLSRPGAQSIATIALPATAFAVTTALLLVVAGGALMFWRWPMDDDGFVLIYRVLSVFALALLAVPLLSLGGSAARLSARRRDDRLATLRLLGATPGFVTVMTVLESTVVAIIGAVAGILLYAALIPLVGLIPFRGEAIGAGSLWVGPWILLAVAAGVAIVAALSAAVGLRRVNISPLGVRTKQEVPRMRWIRAAIAAVVVIAGSVVLGQLGALGSALAMMLVLAGVFAAGVGVLGIIGPWLVGVHARGQARRAKDARHLIAARTVLESPKAAWRQVGGIAMTTFIAVVGGSGMAFAGGIDAGDMAGPEMFLADDIRTGVLITLVVSFLMVACSVGVNQAAAILDRRAVFVASDRMGMPREVMESARVRSTMSPLLFTMIVAALAGGLLVFPVVGLAMIVAPLSVLVIVVCLAAGVALVRLALVATRPVLTRVLAEPERAAE
ncbi:FtsX-like permease family protein [Microbacterium sp. gxy059]|uniref:FtsX-like permease family protein n=1 Tax=Microbacterium sp. gxy059 TaxID=2957199 RepID=UPI003D961971